MLRTDLQSFSFIKTKKHIQIYAGGITFLLS